MRFVPLESRSTMFEEWGREFIQWTWYFIASLLQLARPLLSFWVGVIIFLVVAGVLSAFFVRATRGRENENS